MLQMSIKPGIEPAVGDQLLMLTLLGDAPAVEYQDPVGLFNRRQTVSNDQRRASLQKAPEPLVQSIFGGRVER